MDDNKKAAITELKQNAEDLISSIESALINVDSRIDFVHKSAVLKLVSYVTLQGHGAYKSADFIRDYLVGEDKIELE